MNWDALDTWWTSHVTRKTLFLLFLGQVDSFILALVSFSSFLVADLGTRYSLWQLSGAALCVLGIGLVLLSVAVVGGGGGSRLQGLFWVICLSLLGFYQILAFVGFVMLNFMFYSITPFVLKLNGATVFNLSTLASDMWAVVIRIFF